MCIFMTYINSKLIVNELIFIKIISTNDRLVFGES